MSSGTFGYPLGFAACIAVIGLVVSGGPMKQAPALVRSSDRGVANGWRREAISRELIERCDDYVRKYPDSDDLEMFAGMAIFQFVEFGDWDEVGKRCGEFLKRFPDSGNRGDYRFFQGLSRFAAGDVRGAITIFRQVLRDSPNCGLARSARHYLARSYFLRDHEGLEDIPDWLMRAPLPFKQDARAGFPFVLRKQSEACSRYGSPSSDAYISPYCVEENNDGSEEGLCVIRDLGEFSARHSNDAAEGSTFCLLGCAHQAAGNVEEALECYRKAAWSECPDDVAALALDSAAALLLYRDGRAAAVGLYREFLKHRPEGVLGVEVAGKLATVFAKEGNVEEAEKIQTALIKPRIGDPSAMQAEFLIDELVKSMVPRGNVAEMDADGLDQQLVERLEGIAGDDANATAKARIYYARASLAQRLRRADRRELYLKGVAMMNAKDLSVLSPALLSGCGELLLKDGELDRAETMYLRLRDHFAETSGDVAGVGLGRIALARGKPEDALGIFNGVLERNPDARVLPGATVGKLQALLEMNRIDEVLTLALESVANKALKGEAVARVYLLLGRAYERKAEGGGADAKGFLRKAFDAYHRVSMSYLGFPEIRDEALKLGDAVWWKL